jgi:hypothetical protein
MLFCQWSGSGEDVNAKIAEGIERKLAEELVQKEIANVMVRKLADGLERAKQVVPEILCDASERTHRRFHIALTLALNPQVPAWLISVRGL